MPVTKEQLAKIIGGKARDLCSPEGDRMISEARNARSGGNGYDPNPDEYGDYEEFDRMYLNEDEDTQSSDIHYSRKNAEYSMLPENVTSFCALMLNVQQIEAIIINVLLINLLVRVLFQSVPFLRRQYIRCACRQCYPVRLLSAQRESSGCLRRVSNHCWGRVVLHTPNCDY